MKAMEAPVTVFAGVFIFFAAPRVNGAPDGAEPIIEKVRLGAAHQPRVTSACDVLQLLPPLPAAADLSCRWVPAGSKKAAPVLGTGAPPCPDAWGLTCPIGRDCLATVADGTAVHTGPF